MNQFKRAQVILLETKEKSNIWSNKDRRLYYNQANFNDIEDEIRYNLYIISDDEIKDGDWYINILQDNTIYKNNIKNYNVNKSYLKKIISTTDNSLFIELLNQCDGCKANIPLIDKIHREGKELGMACSKHKYRNYLPQPSQQFIEKYIEEYNKGNIIKDIQVEYEEFYNDYGETEIFDLVCTPHSKMSRLKVNSKDNTITIKQVKESWNREEVIELLKLSNHPIKGIKPGSSHIHLNNWIKENL